MVTFGILRVEAQTWTFDNRDKHAWEKNHLKYYVSISIFPLWYIILV